MAHNPIELNDQFLKALEAMERTCDHVFVTGKAGTGKSTLLEYFRSMTSKRVVVLAPTGVAALNVRGQTIHSFFGFKPDITLDKVKRLKGKRGRIFRELDAIVIDEVSMVRADVLDCIERSLRLNGREPGFAFGGIQMIFIGDLYQLPPVVTPKEKEIFTEHYRSPYFFSAQAFSSFSMQFIELEKVYRQKDKDFIALLNAIRNNSVTEEMLSKLNRRVGVATERSGDGPFAVHLTTTNAMAAQINSRRLQELHTQPRTYGAEVLGDFNQQSYPADADLQVCVGSQVMMLNNDAKGRWVNGSLGKIKGILKGGPDDPDVIGVELEEGGVVDVLPHDWELFRYRFNDETLSIETEQIGTFRQYPLKLAWAITIHKSQGKTFDRVVIDMGFGAFAHGQTYVALSRCRTLEGITLKRPIRKSDVRMDWNIVQFLTRYQYAISERKMPFEEKMRLIGQAIREGRYLDIVYLKRNDEKSRRVIKPIRVGEHHYRDMTFTGVNGYCLKRGQERVFRIERILELRLTEPEE